VTVSLRKKGGEFDTKNWALVTFSEPEAAGRALFSEVSDHWSHPHCESAAPAPRSPV
jgi:hypothetical protein